MNNVALTLACTNNTTDLSYSLTNGEGFIYFGGPNNNYKPKPVTGFLTNEPATLQKVIHNLSLADSRDNIAKLIHVDMKAGIVFVARLGLSLNQHFEKMEVENFWCQAPGAGVAKFRFSENFKVKLWYILNGCFHLAAVGVFVKISEEMIYMEGEIPKLTLLCGDDSRQNLQSMLKDVGDIVSRIRLKFEVSESDLSEEVSDFLSKLNRLGDVRKLSQHPALLQDGARLEFIVRVYKAARKDIRNLSLAVQNQGSKFHNWVALMESYKHFKDVIAFSRRILNKTPDTSSLYELLNAMRNTRTHINEEIPVFGYSRKVRKPLFCQIPHINEDIPVFGYSREVCKPPFSPIPHKGDTEYSKEEAEAAVEILFPKLALHLHTHVAYGVVTMQMP